MRCSGRSRLRASLLLLLSGNVCSALADDNFIVQPKLRTEQAAEKSSVATDAKPIQPLASDETPAIDLRSSSATDSSASMPQSTVHGGFQTPNQYASPISATGEQLASTQLAPNQMRRPVEESNELRWVSRSGMREREVSNRSAVNANLAISQAKPSTRVTASTASNTSTTSTASTATNAEPRDEKQVLAALVSNRLIDSIKPIDQPRVQAIDSAPGWQAVGERLTLHLQAAEKLLRRKAIHSAREEAEAAALYLTRTLDLAVNSYAAEPGWRAAEQAFREAKDFYLHQSSDELALRRVVDAHRTPVLKTVDLSAVSPLVAAQHYRQYAFENLIAASQGHPWASEVMSTLARTYQSEVELNGGISDETRSRAATYYRAAVAISPRNSLAANQLGFLLLKMDRPQEAVQSLVTALKAEASEPALENLVEAGRRLGDVELQNWAMQQLTALRSRRPATTAVPAVTEVDVQSFISLSPYNSGPHPGMASPPAAAPPAAQQPSYTAAVPRSFR